MFVKALIPPPVVLLICGLLMWLADKWTPSLDFQIRSRMILFRIILFGGMCVLAAGVVNIIRRKTTIHPDRRSLAASTALVTTGVFRYTRNPIYLGMAIILTAWVVFLESWLALIGVFVFIAFITQYQIRPEEVALEKIFGDVYVRYRKNVRRWI